MLRSFTRNYQDNSTEAGFQFTFYCDICNDGFKSSFVESETYKKGKLFRGVGRGASVVGSMIGGNLGNMAWRADRVTDILGERFEGRSPEWQKEHEMAFERAQNEARQHFHRCHGCNQYVCDSCYNEDEGLCTQCAPRQEIYVAKARAEAMKRNIDVRAKLAVLSQYKSNLLILDEPTNHLDVRAKEALKKALIEYPGAIILVCHEEDFAMDVCTDIFDAKAKN